MTVKAKNTLTVTWEIVKSVASGIMIFLLTGILTYQKKTYDWQIKMESRMQNMETSAASQADLISKRQDYEHNMDQKQSVQDKQITFLFARFKLPLIQN